MVSIPISIIFYNLPWNLRSLWSKCLFVLCEHYLNCSSFVHFSVYHFFMLYFLGLIKIFPILFCFTSMYIIFHADIFSSCFPPSVYTLVLLLALFPSIIYFSLVFPSFLLLFLLRFSLFADRCWLIVSVHNFLTLGFMIWNQVATSYCCCIL